MFETKLIQLFIRFSAEERRKLRKWVVSDFVNKNEDVIRFFTFLDTRSSINESTVTKEKAHEYLYRDTKFNDLRIRHLIWMTTEIFENFVAYIAITAEQSLREQLLARYYIDKELFKFANQALEDGMALNEKMPLRNGYYYINKYQLSADHYHVNSRNNRSRDFNLQEIIDSTALFSIIETLKYACIIQSLQKISAHKLDNHLLEPVLAVIQKPGFLDVLPVRIYYNIYRVITEEDDKAFESFIEDIKKNNRLFSVQDLRDLYLLAINYCIKKSNQNILHYTNMAFELYLYAVQQGFLIENHEISRFSFTNVVTLGLKLKEFDKTEQFVKDFAALIATEYRQNTIDFNTAKILYSREQYKKALQILLTNEFKDTIWNLNAKYLAMKIFYETNDMESFDTYLKAFKIYIKRKTNVGYHKTYFTNVMKALSTLNDIYNRPHKYKDYTFSADTPDVDWFNRVVKKKPVRT
jgi:hypothetical protein